MNMNDDEVAVVMSRKQLAMMLQALDALIDDAEWFLRHRLSQRRSVT
jgi:hypothetical protein